MARTMGRRGPPGPIITPADFGISEISLANEPKSLLYRSLSCPTEGRAHVTNAGRDAVDAGSARDERGLLAYGEVVSFWRPNAGVKSARRSAGDGVKQAWSPGRARSKP